MGGIRLAKSVTGRLKMVQEDEIVMTLKPSVVNKKSLGSGKCNNPQKEVVTIFTNFYFYQIFSTVSARATVSALNCSEVFIKLSQTRQGPDWRKIFKKFPLCCDGWVYLIIRFVEKISDQISLFCRVITDYNYTRTGVLLCQQLYLEICIKISSS